MSDDATSPAETGEAKPEKTDAAVQEAFDEAARAKGFADHAAMQAAEEAAAKAKPKKRTRARKSSGFTAKAVDPALTRKLAERAAEGGTAKIALGTERGPDDVLPQVEVGLVLGKSRITLSRKIAFSAAALPGDRKLTHVYAIGGEGKSSSVMAMAELAAPIVARPGEQVKFTENGVCFPVPAAEAA